MSHSLKTLILENNYSYCVTNSLWTWLRISRISNNFNVFHIPRRRSYCNVPPPKSDYRKTTKTSPTTKKSRGARQEEKISCHLSQCNKNLDIKSIPRKYLTSTVSTAEGFFVVGLQTAKTIANKVVESDAHTPIFEINPGVGAVTDALLRKGACEIHAFQSTPWGNQRALRGKDLDRVILYKNDFFSLWKRLLLDHYDDKTANAVLNIVKTKPWSDGPPVKVFAGLPNRSFINHMIASLVFQKGFFRLGRLEFYLAMRPYDYLKVTCDESSNYAVYRAASVNFQIMFESNILCKLPAKDFIPWVKPLPANRKNNFSQILDADADCVYLVKITPRKNIYDQVGGEDGLKALWHFVRQSFAIRTNKVIPMLEKWIPGCGPRLIFTDLTIYTEFGELSPAKMLTLFQAFSKWPEYPHCSFLDSMDAYFLSSYIESNPDGVGEADYESAERDLDAHHDFEAVSDSRETIR